MPDYSWMNTAKPTQKQVELPVGVYKAFTEEFSNYQTKSGGRAVKIVFNVLEGTMQGRKTTQYFNIPDGMLQKTDPKMFEFQKNQICELAFWFNNDAGNIMEFLNNKNYPLYKDKVFVIEIKEYTKKNGEKAKGFKITEAIQSGNAELKTPDPFKEGDDPFATD